MNDAQRVIDEIDALIDEQLAAGEPRVGYEFDDPGYPRCRCGSTWHGLPKNGCPGTDAEGPRVYPTGSEIMPVDYPLAGLMTAAADEVIAGLLAWLEPSSSLPESFISPRPTTDGSVVFQFSSPASHSTEQDDVG